MNGEGRRERWHEWLYMDAIMSADWKMFNFFLNVVQRSTQKKIHERS